jgi:DNA-binding MarR family transcriptional regulator
MKTPMSTITDRTPVPLTPGLVEAVREQFSALNRLLAVTDAQRWMSLDITMPQLKVMLFLWHSGRARVGVLAEHLGVHLSNVSGILDRLVEAGLVYREDDADDRRLVVSRLTPKGEAMLANLYAGRIAYVGERLQHLSAHDLQALHDGLGALLASW